ncbi:MAG: superoxide dismutase [Alphaproteobacteria bacterium]|nr:superoxide dismutase [Alphaproteobacteria bacterium]
MFTLDQFPLHFVRDSLEPYISATAIDYHYDKHLGGYISNLNTLIKGTEFENASLEYIVKNSDGKIFNNAAQIFNHVFFFNGLKNSGDGIPTEIESAFKDFKSEFKTAALSVFGSGWVWLIDDDGTLKIITTANADSPIKHGQKPLMTLDVWEHAYYLDYQNRRGDFCDAFLDHLVNWEFVTGNSKK